MCTESGGCVRLIVNSLEECLEREFKQSSKGKPSQQEVELGAESERSSIQSHV